jgi:50S ribosomal protein L16 3-hydroxylase
VSSGAQLQLDREAFLARYWQRKPSLMPQAVPGFKPPLTRHQLAGLALEDGVESRMIECVEGQWRVRHGPFESRELRREGPWTLLVQAADHHVPEVARLRRLVDFIPQWRVDDVMVSYASDGGSVGPHFDNYDVFLLQGEGERLWRVGQFCDGATPLVPHEELRLLQQFDTREEYLLRKGDILYLPPGFAHWGIARGECTTFSIGFRAPRINDLVARWADQLLECLDPDLFYRDAGLAPVSRAGEIRPRDMERVLAQLQGALDQECSNHWFGELVTEPRYEPEPDDDDLAEARALLAGGAAFVELSPAARLAWQQEAAGIAVFANGQSRHFDGAVLPSLTALCEQWRLEGAALGGALADEAGADLLGWLLESGCIYVE